jgi:hypothetical protein
MKKNYINSDNEIAYMNNKRPVLVRGGKVFEYLDIGDDRQ